jgi:CubicO group peptidase (beta-lactamase class C family)
MSLLDLLQWPAMLVTVAGAWLVASGRKYKRNYGFWAFLASNVLWVIWGVHDRAWALVVLQVCLAALNIRGATKTAPAALVLLALGLGAGIAAPGPLAAQRPAAQRPAAGPGWAEFTRAFDDFARADSVVGGAAVLMRDGRILARHDYGWADRDARQRVDSTTLFHYASITKTLGAVAVLQLRDRGLLSLDDPATKYLPELRRVHAGDWSVDDVTIRMLLSHSGGFRGGTWPYGEGRPWEPFEPTEWSQLVAMMPYQQLLFRPGARYSYSNPSYVYVAEIVERLAGEPWEAYVMKHVFGPLGMTRSYFGRTPAWLEPHRSNRYTVRRDSSGGVRPVAGGREFDPGITIPNSGWNAPLSDVARWAAFLTSTGAADSATARRHASVLKRSSLEEMWRPVVPLDAGNPRGDSMGLGFFVGGGLVGHDGDQAGFRSFLYFDPRTRTALAFVVNTDHAADADGYEARLRALWARGFALLRR